MKVWGLAATLGFSILAFVLGQMLGMAALTAVKPFDPLHPIIDTDGTAIAIVTLIGNPVQVVTLVLAARLTGTDILSYFALVMPRWRDAALAVAALAGAIVLGDVLTLALGHELVPSFWIDVHRSAQADGTLPWLWLALIVFGPIGEELLFRGFLFRGLVHEPRDALPGILAIALIWALLHVQYDWESTGIVFAIGVLFGYLRLLTGSTLLVIFLHMLLNVESLGETMVALGWI